MPPRAGRHQLGVEALVFLRGAGVVCTSSLVPTLVWRLIANVAQLRSSASSVSP